MAEDTPSLTIVLIINIIIFIVIPLVMAYRRGYGFMFEVSQSLKHNLISPDVLAFFDGVKESGDITEECAFPASIPLTNQRNSIFHNIGEEWIICYDGIFRKCPKVECEVKFQSIKFMRTCFIDKAIKHMCIHGVLSLHPQLMP